MSFSDDVAKFAVKVTTNSRAIFVNSASHAHESIVNGSTVTGSPGQPVDTGTLRSSWQLNFTSPTEAQISTSISYAPYVEQGINRWGPVTYKNHGPHSVALTITGMDRIVAYETAKVVT